MILRRQGQLVLHRYFGPFGVTVSFTNEGDAYGLIGSRGYSVNIVGWRDSEQKRKPS